MNSSDVTPVSSRTMTSSENSSMFHLPAPTTPTTPTNQLRITDLCGCYDCRPTELSYLSPWQRLNTERSYETVATRSTAQMSTLSPPEGSTRLHHAALTHMSSPPEGSSRFTNAALTGMSPPDTVTVKHENTVLQSRLRQLLQDLQIEQDMVATLRKKMNSTERERLDASAKANQEMSRLDAELTKTRAQLEKGEAVRQNMAFELTRWRQELTSEKRASQERENLLSDVNQKLKDKINMLSQQIEQLCRQLEAEKSSHHEETNRLRFNLEEKDRDISHRRTEKDYVEAERDKLETALQQQERTVLELESRLRELEDDNRHQTDSLRKQTNENELLREREERTRKELEMSTQRVKQLEESIEAERAAHLESKFNSEIVQLRIRDLESALNMEKSTKSEALETIEKLNNQVRDLQTAFAEERHESAESKSKLEKAEKEYAILSQKLSEELDEKRSMIKKLSKQLELHQGNFNDLKDELNKAKKSQIYLEETYSGSMKEIELLVNTFCVEPPAGKKGKSQSKRKDGVTKLTSPTSLLEALRHTLTSYSRKNDALNTEVDKAKAASEKLSKDLETCRNQMWAKDKALEDTQHAVTRTSKQLRKIQTDGATVEKRLQETEEELKGVTKALEREREEHRELQQQMVKVATKYKAEEKSRCEFLHALYQTLLTGRLLAHTEGGSTLGAFSWDDLSVLITEQVALLLNTLNRAEEKVKYLETTLDTKESTIGQIQESHDRMLGKIANAAEGQTLSWQQQKQEMEDHYALLLAEVHARHRKAQSLSDQAWEKVRALGLVQQSLESECAEVKAELDQSETEKSSLLYTCRLLIGSHIPLVNRCESLALQRNILMQQVNNYFTFKHQMATLVNTLKMDDETGLRRISPLVRFRVGVLAVMAANRLAHWSREGRLTVTMTTGAVNIPVTMETLATRETTFKGVSESRLLGDEAGRQGDDALLLWLHNNKELLTVVTRATSELREALGGRSDEDKEMDAKSLANLVRRTFSALTSSLIGSQPTNQHAAYNDRSSLVHRLNTGLHNVLNQSSLDDTPDVVASKNIRGRLEVCLLEFTRRLHTVEVERRDLRSEVSRLRSEHQKHVTDEQNQLKQQLVAMVPREKLDAVCVELDHALSREQRAQLLLREQNQQLSDLGYKVDLQTTLEIERGASLTDAVQELSDVKLELKRRDASVRQMNRHIQTTDREREILRRKVEDAENALRTAVKDRDALTKYVSNVEGALEKSQTAALLHGTIGALDLSPLLSKDMVTMETSKPGPQVVACQGLVAAFVGAQQMLNSKLSSLQEEILDHKQHINTLKKELAEMCRRECEGEVDLKMVGSLTPQKQFEFSPLIEDHDSLGFPTPTVYSKQKGSRTPQSSAYTTPRQSRNKTINSKHST